MDGSLVADLGVGPETWLFITLLGCLTLFFKFSRFWSVRNLDLVLLFALVPGMMLLVSGGSTRPWIAFVWLFVGTLCWLFRCLLDVGLTRRPVVEPNLNAAGLACLSFGVLGLLVVETVSLPVSEGSGRNPAETQNESGPEPPPPGSTDRNAPVNQVIAMAPLPKELKRYSADVILSRVIAASAQAAIVLGLMAVGWRHYERPLAGLSAAACHVLLPYSRFALVDNGQLVPSALIIAALNWHTRPAVAGALIGIAAGWMPACLGLVVLWAGYYRRRGAGRFLLTAVSVVSVCAVVGLFIPESSLWARALQARSLAEAGLLTHVEAPEFGSFWSGIDSSYRLPIVVAYVALVLTTAVWPSNKNFGELVALSAALLVASQFWYMAAGGTLVLLYLPLVILMVFRPSLVAKKSWFRPPSSSSPRPDSKELAARSVESEY
ncbi:MAG: hypothetical protein SFX72_18895 [Isosphaeraceae bacterium]|nr:hypothetical protein [Isosphaeraceae bacterium]